MVCVFADVPLPFCKEVGQGSSLSNHPKTMVRLQKHKPYNFFHCTKSLLRRATFGSFIKLLCSIVTKCSAAPSPATPGTNFSPQPPVGCATETEQCGSVKYAFKYAQCCSTPTFPGPGCRSRPSVHRCRAADPAYTNTDNDKAYKLLKQTANITFSSPTFGVLAFLSFTYKYVVHADGSIGNSDVKHFHITAVKQYHFYSSFVAYSESGSTDNFATSFFLFPLEIMVLLTVGLGY